MFNTVAIQKKMFFFQGGDTGREVTVEIVVEVYPIPQPTRGSGGAFFRKLPSGVCLDNVWTFYAQFCAILVVF